MSFPSGYIWKHGVSITLTNHRQKTKVQVYNMYGTLLSSFDVVHVYQSNLNNVRFVLSKVTGLSISNYSFNPSSLFKDKKQQLSNNQSEYILAYKHSIPIFRHTYYENKTYKGVNLGAYDRTRQIDLIGRQGRADEDIYYYKNGFVYVFDQGQSYSFTAPNGQNFESTTIEKGYEVYVLKKTKIDTKCCLQAMCNPLKYNYIGDK